MYGTGPSQLWSKKNQPPWYKLQPGQSINLGPRTCELVQKKLKTTGTFVSTIGRSKWAPWEMKWSEALWYQFRATMGDNGVSCSGGLECRKHTWSVWGTEDLDSKVVPTKELRPSSKTPVVTVRCVFAFFLLSFPINFLHHHNNNNNNNNNHQEKKLLVAWSRWCGTSESLLQDFQLLYFQTPNTPATVGQGSWKDRSKRAQPILPWLL